MTVRAEPDQEHLGIRRRTPVGVLLAEDTLKALEPTERLRPFKIDLAAWALAA
jgi:hypothetical protein